MGKKLIADSSGLKAEAGKSSGLVGKNRLWAIGKKQ